MRTLTAVTVAFTIFLFSHAVRADPLPDKPSVFETTATCTTAGGAALTLPPGWWLVPPSDWKDLDAELSRLQVVETRLTAENLSLKTSALERRSRWWFVSAGLAAGWLGRRGWDWARSL